MASTYDFFSFLDTGLNLRDVSLRLIVGSIVNFIFAYYAKRLLCI